MELDDLKKMIRKVCRGAAALDPKVTTEVVFTVSGMAATGTNRSNPASSAASLSETDLTIIRSLAEGMSNKEIGQRIHLSPHTVKDRLEKIFAVLAEAMRRGLI